MAGAAEAYERVRPERRVERPGRPDLRVVRGRGRAGSERVLSPAHTYAFKAFCVAVAVIACFAVARVAFSAATVSTLMDSRSKTAQIEEAYAAGSDLEVSRSVLGSPARIQSIASEQLGMHPAESVSYLDVSSATDEQDVGAVSDDDCSLAVAVSQLAAADATRTQAASESGE